MDARTDLIVIVLCYYFRLFVCLLACRVGSRATQSLRLSVVAVA